VRGDGELGREFAERSDARLVRVGFDAADVGVADTLERQLALAESELESPLTDPVHQRLPSLPEEGIAVPRIRDVTASAGEPSGRPDQRSRSSSLQCVQMHDSDDAVEIVREISFDASCSAG
jgi:hypothetical protein